MSESEPGDAIVRKARSRARFCAVRRAMTIILALTFLAAASGFCWGMWDEVSAAPQTYADVPCHSGVPFLERWSARAATIIVDLRGDIQGRKGINELAWGEVRSELEGEPTPGSRRTPFRRPGPRTTRPPGQAADDPPDVPLPRYPEQVADPAVDLNPTHQGDNTGGTTTVKPDVAHLDPAHRKPVKPVPVRTAPKLDKKTREMLTLANETCQRAWGYYRMAGPMAPAGGRDAAGRKAIKFFNLSKKRYEALLKRKLPGKLRKEIEDHFLAINRALYWTYKHTRVK